MPLIGTFGAASAKGFGFTTKSVSVPGAPTIGTATVASSTSATVSYTAPASNGGSVITSYTATSSPGGITGTLATSGSGTITVSGLTLGTAYTFTVKATNSVGQSAASAASNTVYPGYGEATYTSRKSSVRTFTWVAPAGVTSVSAVVISSTAFANVGSCLSYKNNIAVTPGNSYTVYFYGANGDPNYFISAATVSAKGQSTRVGDGGGNGGASNGGRGGAGGYSGNGGIGGSPPTYSGTSGTGGAGGGGGFAWQYTDDPCCGRIYTAIASGGGGGVGLLGQGSSGAGGYGSFGTTAYGGGGGSGGTDGATVSGLYPDASGGDYGGGGYGGTFPNGDTVNGTVGIRIIWPGTLRSFPSTNTGAL